MTPSAEAKLVKLPSAVLMDLDNTIYDYESAHKAALLSVGMRVTAFAGITQSQFLEHFGLAKKTVKSRVGKTAASHSRILYFKELLESLGYGPQVLLCLELEQNYWRVFLQNMKIYDGVVDFLDELRIQGVPVALVTDLTLQIQLRKIGFLGLENAFSAIVTSEEVGVEKPNPEPFLLAIEKVSATHGDVWFIGDDHVKDIQGAKTHLGAITFQKLQGNDMRVSDGDRADVEFRNFGVLNSILSRIERN
jgi:HAD superfamily hydrolase (TIGR01549 family)